MANSPSLSPSARGPLQAVIFDFDGVIVDTEEAVYAAWAEVYQRYGAELPLELYSRCVGSDHATWDPKAYFEETTGLALDWPPILEAKNQRTRDLLEGYGPMPGVVEWLRNLEDAGIPVAVASSSSAEWVGGWLEKLGLAGYFHSWHCRGDVARVKPAPDLFLRAADALGLPADSLLVIEDSANGLRAATSAGMRALVVPNRITSHQDFQGAWHQTDSLATTPWPTVQSAWSR